jgi:hypothetical protein
MATRKQVTELARELIENLPSLTKPRTDLIAFAVLALVVTQSSNLVRIAATMSTKCKRLSNYRRLQRFIDQVQWVPLELMKLIVKWAGLHPPFILLIDRTTWYFGKQPINILCISILGDGFSVPLIWSLLDKKGNSRQKERIDLLQKVIDIFGQDHIQGLVADREFTGEHWFKYLNDNDIQISIRVAKNRKVKRYKRYRPILSIIEGNKRKGATCDGKRYWLCGIQVYVHGFTIRNDKGKLESLIVVSQTKDDNLIDLYAKRWYIENMFRDLKSNGFNLEQTHVQNLDRLHTLLGLIGLAHAWAIKVGTYIKKSQADLFKLTKNKRPRKNIFKAGLEALAEVFFTSNTYKIWKYIRFLSCT